MIRKLTSGQYRAVFTQDRPQDGQTPQPRHLRNPQEGGETRASCPVLQAIWVAWTLAGHRYGCRRQARAASRFAGNFEPPSAFSIEEVTHVQDR